MSGTDGLSNHIRKYLLDKTNYTCEIPGCGCNAKLDITIENASKPELWYRYPSNPNTFKECFKLFNLCFYRNVVKDPIDKIINWFKK